MNFFGAGHVLLLNKATNQLEAKRIDYVEIDILLTAMLQRLHETGLTERLVFKGGTMLRKMVFGKNGRLSTDLDFTVRSVEQDEKDDIILKILEAFATPFAGITFDFAEKDIGSTPTSSRANPKCKIAGSGNEYLIKLEVSHRADPVLDPVLRKHQVQPYFPNLGFDPADIPCLQLEEAIGEKIRAAFQRPKIRDLHDLQQLRGVGFDQDLVRKLTVLKLWESPEGVSFTSFSHETFATRLQDRVKAKAYNEKDLSDLLHRKAKFDMGQMADDVTKTYGFLSGLTDEEKKLLADRYQNERGLYEEFRQQVRDEAAPASPSPP